MTESVRFVHAADLHLDAPFKGVDATDARVKDALVASTYRALDALVSACLEHRADFLVIAGDIYNASEKSLRAEFAFRDACVRLTDAGIPVYIARGNHDPLIGRWAGIALPEGVHVFSGDAVERIPFERDGRTVCALYGRSFRTAAEKTNLAPGYRRDPADELAVAVLHANVGGRPDHEPYAPCSLDDLRAAQMDYWALGHIHKAEVLAENPPVVYAGCTQGLTPNEQGIRGCRLVTLGPDGATTEMIPTSSVVWQQHGLDVNGLDGAESLLDALGSAVDRMAESAEGRPVIARISLLGRTPLHHLLATGGALADILTEVRTGALMRDPWVWVDRITDSTRPEVDLDVLRAGEDLAADLLQIADDLAADDERRTALIQEVLEPVLGKVDAKDRPIIDAGTILERARDLALDRLLEEEAR